MAKIARSYSFSNATISREDDGTYVLTEFTKDDSKDFNFTQVLDDLLGLDGLSIVIKQSVDLTPGE